jgi:hypothetical protein
MSIIRMAREAGCIPVRHPEYDNDVQIFATPDELERFAALVRADEREACAEVCEEVLERYRGTAMGKHAELVGDDCVAAIRARGQA